MNKLIEHISLRVFPHFLFSQAQRIWFCVEVFEPFRVEFLQDDKYGST